MLMYNSSDLEIKTVTIAAGGSLSTALDKRYFTYMSILLPSTWTTASITFAGCDTTHGSFNQVVSATDVSEVEIPSVAASKVIVLDTEFMEAVLAIPWIKLRSGTANSPVTQTTEQKIKIALRR